MGLAAAALPLPALAAPAAGPTGGSAARETEKAVVARELWRRAGDRWERWCHLSGR